MASNLIKIYIGRDVDCDYRITSIEISRKHALLEYSESDHFWQISDLNSTNGLFVNSVQLQAFSPYRLVNGDRVSFGPPNQSQFCYQFVDNSAVYELRFGVPSIPLIPTATREQPIAATNLVGLQASAMPTRSGLEYAVTTSRAQRNIGPNPAVIAAKKVMARKVSADSAGRQAFAEHDYSLNSSSADKNRRSVSKRLKLKDISDSKAKAMKMESERKYLDEEKKKLEKSRRSLERKKNLDQLKIKRKEEALKKKQKELARKEREAKKREEELEKLREDLMKEKKMLADKKDQESAKAGGGSAKRKLRSSSVRESETNETKRQCREDKKVMEELLESELTCSICSEYFIQAVNLNCSHTFCEQCIEEWKRTNVDEAVCPICRHPIENQNRELVLDNLIDQFITATKPSLIEHRKRVAEERKKKMAKKAQHSKTTGASARERLTRLIPSLQFFLRSATGGHSSSDSDTENEINGIININMNNFESSSSVSSWSDSSDSDSDDSSDSSSSSSSSSSEDSVASSQNSAASVRSVRSDHNYIDIDISSLYSSAASANGSNGDNDSHFSDSDSDVESVVSIRSNDNRIEIELNSDDSDDSDYSVDD